MLTQVISRALLVGTLIPAVFRIEIPRDGPVDLSSSNDTSGRIAQFGCESGSVHLVFPVVEANDAPTVGQGGVASADDALGPTTTSVTWGPFKDRTLMTLLMR